MTEKKLLCLICRNMQQRETQNSFTVNIQVPGSTTYSLTLYYMMSTPIEDSPLLESFVKGDDAYLRSMQLMLHAIALNSLDLFNNWICLI
ncbi:Putative disease resistance protein RGA1 [Olea europaea subsp. europaea]|uniref:Disease resistance protein RGA1 n=1 Tax=Olea europaea subsp. europaea TaxID=158383 RepID=A0A8S0S1H2_OLEEU|nr:Putative disease resistance protein RGA1 [Olea europaea subsp. europaea]